MFNNIFKKATMSEPTEELLKAETTSEEINEEIEGTETTETADPNPIAEMQAQISELKDKYLRLFAEFDNYKKRTSQERLELMKTAARETMTALLPVVDDFERAKKASENPLTGEVFTEGIALVYHKLHQILSARGLTAMESNNQEFNPEMHEAITEIPAPTEALKGKVVDTVEKGYLLNDKIIRYAKVVVGR
jgi:molecular chaperone GrpE